MFATVLLSKLLNYEKSVNKEDNPEEYCSVIFFSNGLHGFFWTGAQ